MDHGACNVIYLDRRARDDTVRRETLLADASSCEQPPQELLGTLNGYSEQDKLAQSEIRTTLEATLSKFSQVHVCSSGASCLAKLAELYTSDSLSNPTILLIDIPYDEEKRLRRQSREPRTPSPTFRRRPVSELIEPSDIYGMYFLQHISTEIQQRSLSTLVVPIVVLSGLDKTPSLSTSTAGHSPYNIDAARMVRYLDAGAADVLTSPLSADCMHGLVVHAYKVYRQVTRENSGFMSERKNRKLSWVGVDDVRPYAYLREAMVSGLMGGICNPQSVGELLDPRDIEVDHNSRDGVARAIGRWSFSAHNFTDDELLLGALIMLEHALKMPELQKWKKSTDELLVFLIASRKAYNNFVLYHNFRHVADVLQAIFYFLVQLGILPPYEFGDIPPTDKPSAIASLLKPFDALTLLISAIGHDVGHPGVNNAFLVALNSPLAQLYNDRSVLESFHCAAYSQILRRYWPEAFQDVSMRRLMINSILATDMGLHFKYMADLGNLQEKLAHNDNTLDGWSPKVLEEYKDLTCGLLIKCADISNVARKFEVAAEWANILTDEFSNQGNMEKELDIPTTLFGGPPERDNLIALGESQVGFMNIFAQPLFEAVTDILPAMSFSVAQIVNNKGVWQSKNEAEKIRQSKSRSGGLLGVYTDVGGERSPRSGSKENLAADLESEVQMREENLPSRSVSGDSPTVRNDSITNADTATTASSNTPTPANNMAPGSPLSASSSRPSSSSINSPAVPFHPAAMSSRTQSDITSRRSSSGATSFPVSRRCDPSDEERPDSSAVDMDIDLSPFINPHHDSLGTTARTSSEVTSTSCAKATPTRNGNGNAVRPFSSPSVHSDDSSDITEFAKRFSFKHQDLSHSLSLSPPNGYVMSELTLPSSPDSSHMFHNATFRNPAIHASPKSRNTIRNTHTATPQQRRHNAPSAQSTGERRKHSSRRPFGAMTKNKQDRNSLRHVSSSSALPRYPATSGSELGTPEKRTRIRADGDERSHQQSHEPSHVKRNSVFGHVERPEDDSRTAHGGAPGKFGLKFWRRRWGKHKERPDDSNGYVDGVGVPVTADTAGAQR